MNDCVYRDGLTEFKAENMKTKLNFFIKALKLSSDCYHFFYSMYEPFNIFDKL